MATIALAEPQLRKAADRPGWQAFLAMAFRPFYLAAALFGASAVIAWVAGFGGSAALPGALWHGHEMIWGYAGAVIVGFLLTAVATWTGQPPLSGRPLAGLFSLWMAARLAAVGEAGAPWLTGLCSVGFFLAAAAALAVPIWRSRNRRNSLVPLLLIAFGLADGGFLLAAHGALAIDPQRLLMTGLVLVAAFITVIGLRVIPFFAHRALQTPQITHPRWAGWAALAAPLVLAACVATRTTEPIGAVAGLVGMLFNLVLLGRNLRRGVLRQPLLWVLFAGYALTALGLGLAGLALAGRPALLSAAIHLVAVGGIGVLTLGMMSRTALGHTGRPLRLPPAMVPAFPAMLLAAVLRVAAAWPGNAHPMLLPAAGGAFATALLLFVLRYGRWLICSRADGLPG